MMEQIGDFDATQVLCGDDVQHFDINFGLQKSLFVLREANVIQPRDDPIWVKIGINLFWPNIIGIFGLLIQKQLTIM